MSDNAPPRVSRRGFFAGAAATGAVAATAAVMPKIVAPVAVETAAAPAEPKPERGGGYRMSEHIQRYFKTTRV